MCGELFAGVRNFYDVSWDLEEVCSSIPAFPREHFGLSVPFVLKIIYPCFSLDCLLLTLNHKWDKSWRAAYPELDLASGVVFLDSTKLCPTWHSEDWFCSILVPLEEEQDLVMDPI